MLEVKINAAYYREKAKESIIIKKLPIIRPFLSNLITCGDIRVWTYCPQITLIRELKPEMFAMLSRKIYQIRLSVVPGLKKKIVIS